MTSKYQTDDSELIGSLSSQHKLITRQPLFKLETENIEDYNTEKLRTSQLSYFTPDHTHYCLNCRDWYPSKESVFECKLQHATVTHNEHVMYPMLIRDKHSETSNQRNSSDVMKRASDRKNESSYHHIRSVIILLAFTVLMAAITCLFAYLFDQISGLRP